MIKIKLKPKTRKEIANELGISYTTFWRWLKKNEIVLPPGLIYPNMLKKIYAKLEKIDSYENMK